MKFTPVFSFIAGAAAGICLAKCSVHNTEKAIARNKTDTIMVRDTVRIPAPVPESTVIIRTDTVRLLSPGHPDSVSVALPVSQVHYSDSVAEAWISGFRPRLDSLHVFPVSRTVTHTIYRSLTPAQSKTSRWHIGVTAGATATSSGISPGISVGITYSLVDL